MKFFPTLLLTLGFLVAGGAEAGEIIDLYQGTRQMAMGGAFTALADDESAVFLNPAGLAGERGSYWHLVSSDTTLSADAAKTALKSLALLSNFGPDTFNEFIGKNIHVREQVTSIFQFGSFAIAGILDQRVDMLAEDQSFPQIEFGYQTTYGVQGTYATSFKFGGGRSRRNQARSELKVGATFKSLWRQGGVRQLPTSTLLNLSPAALNQQLGPKRQGYGFDLGLLYEHRMSRELKVMASAVALDISDTSFGSGPDPQLMNVTLGLGTSYDLGGVKFTFLYDLRRITQEMDPGKRHNLGMEIKFPVISLYGGWHQASFTLGSSFDIWVFRLTAATYVEEIGTFVNQDLERRFMLKVATKLPL